MIQPHGGIPLPPDSDDLVYDDGEPMESALHRQQMALLIESLEFAWRDRDDFYVGGNMALYFSDTQAKKNDFRAPDVLVVMNTTRRKRKGWVVWDEDGRTPDVIIELLSESTEQVDRGEKMRIYARLRVPEYFLFDPFSTVFEGYELDSRRASYVRKQPDAENRIRCTGLGLWLAPILGTLWRTEARWLRWIDDDGRVLLHGDEAAMVEAERAKAADERAKAADERAKAADERAKAADERAKAAAARAEAADERVARLGAELDELKRR